MPLLLSALVLVCTISVWGATTRFSRASISIIFRTRSLSSVALGDSIRCGAARLHSIYSAGPLVRNMLVRNRPEGVGTTVACGDATGS